MSQHTPVSGHPKGKKVIDVTFKDAQGAELAIKVSELRKEVTELKRRLTNLEKAIKPEETKEPKAPDGRVLKENGEIVT